MKTRLFDLWDTLHSSFWLVPALMTLVAFGLSFAMVAVDEAIKDKVLQQVG